jgi:hypothetical protein
MDRNLKFTSLFLISIFPTCAAAQSPIERAREDYRRGMVRVYESALFKLTQKTSTVIYAKEYSLEDGKVRVCGEALFGAVRQTFVINTSSGVLARAASKAQLHMEGCDAEGAETLIDLR